MKIRQPHPRGATSILITIGFAMLAIGIITGLTSLSIREQRQATDTDQSNRAYAVAESAIRDAVKWIEENPGKEYVDCSNPAQASLTKPTITDSSGQPQQIVCRTVVITTETIESQIRKDDAVTVFTYLPDGNQAKMLKLAWSKAPDLKNIANGLEMFPSSDVWLANKYPSAIEVSVIAWNGAGIGADELADIYSAVYVPKQKPNDPSQFRSYDPSTANCVANGDEINYQCSAEIDLEGIAQGELDGKKIAVRIKSLYADSDIKAEFFTDADQKIRVLSNRAFIDVTARSGDLYRRLRAEKVIANTAVFDMVLYSGKGFCKNLSVKKDYSLISGNNCPESGSGGSDVEVPPESTGGGGNNGGGGNSGGGGGGFK